MDTADRMFREILEAIDRPMPPPAPPLQPALRNVAACYRKAMKDERTKIPTYLHAALEGLIAATPTEPANPYAERRSEPRRYQEERSGGGDIGPGGTQLRPGS